MKKRRLLAIFAALTIGMGAMASLTACDLSEILSKLPGITATEGELESITIATKPTKMAYEIGEKFDPTGMVIKATYEGGKEEEVTDYEISPAGELTAKDTKITITYKGQTTTLRITVSDPVVAVEKLSDPDLTKEYYLGQTFDTTGMKLKLTYKSGKVEEKEIKEIAGVEYSQEKGLTSADKTITISYAGESWTYEVNLILAVYIEAETGKTNDTGISNPTDASESEVKGTLLTLKGNALKKENPEMTEDELQAKLEEYQESDEFKAAVEHYSASGETYLGNLSKGNYVDFEFESDGAGTGNIQFRMSSQKLDIANGWTPIMMGDCQFNQLCEFYVNGIRYDIPDSVILPGGGEEGGPENQLLWVNWQEVLFENISFVEGRNVIRLQFKRHNMVAAAQTGYNFTANIDCLIINSEDCMVNPYGSEATEAKYNAESVELKVEEEKALLVISGKIEGATGYISDLIDYTLSGSASYAMTSIKTEGDQFILTVDVTNAELGTYLSVLGGKTITTEGVKVTETTLNAGINSYNLKIDEQDQIALVIDSDHKAVLIDATVETPALALEERDGKVCVVISGGKATYKIAGYTYEEAKPIIEAAIQKIYYTDFQENNAWGYPLGKNQHTVNLLEDGAFEVVLDVTEGKGYNNGLMLHFVHAREDGTFGSGGDLDFKPDIDTFTLTCVQGETEYKLIYDKSACFGLVYLNTAVVGAPFFSITSIELAERDGKAYAVYKGEYAVYTLEDMQAYVIDGEVTNGREKLPLEFTMNEDGTFEIWADLSGWGNADFYYMHAGFEEAPANLNASNAKIVAGKGELNVGAHTYKLDEQWGCRGVRISDYVAPDPNEPAYATTDVNLVVEGDKLYYVISGTYENYTVEEMQAFAPKFNLQGNPYVGTGSWDGDWGYRTYEKSYTVNADGTWEVKMDISALATANFNYTSHFELNGGDKEDDKAADCKLSTSFEKTYEFNGVTFKLISVVGSDDGGQFWGCVGLSVSGYVAPEVTE